MTQLRFDQMQIDSPKKEECRKIATSNKLTQYEDKAEPAKNAFFLTTPQLKDVRHGIETGTVKPGHTHVTVVEQHKEIIAPIRRGLEKLRLDATVLHKKFEDLEAFDLRPGGLDLAFFDFCGNITEQKLDTMLRLYDKFNLNARVSFTAYGRWRCSKWANKLSRHYNNCIPDEYIDELLRVRAEWFIRRSLSLDSPNFDRNFGMAYAAIRDVIPYSEFELDACFTYDSSTDKRAGTIMLFFSGILSGENLSMREILSTPTAKALGYDLEMIEKEDEEEVALYA